MRPVEAFPPTVAASCWPTHFSKDVVFPAAHSESLVWSPDRSCPRASWHFLWSRCLILHLLEVTFIFQLGENGAETVASQRKPVPLQRFQSDLSLGLHYGSAHRQLAEDADVELLGVWAGQAGLLRQQP